MDRERILAKLREHQAELKGAGIERLAVFGSAARGDASVHSDVDLIGDFDSAKSLTLFDLVGLEGKLSEILGVRVDLSDRQMLKGLVKAKAERESVLAF